MHCGNDCAVREWQRPFPKGFYCNIVAQLGAHLFQFAFCIRQVVDGDQPPVAVSVGNYNAIDRGGIGTLCRGFRDV